MRNPAACSLVLLAFAAALVSSAPAQSQSAYVIIVHPDNPAKSVSKKKVSRLLLGELTKWDGGQPAQPVDQASQSPLRERVSQDVHGRSVSSIKDYWQKQISSGDAVPPPELANDTAVVSFVKKNKGAIGYVAANANLNGVKVLDLSSD